MALKHIDVWQNEGEKLHKSSLTFNGSEVYALGGISHCNRIRFSKKDIPFLIELLTMENSVLIYEGE